MIRRSMLSFTVNFLTLYYPWPFPLSVYLGSFASNIALYLSSRYLWGVSFGFITIDVSSALVVDDIVFFFDSNPLFISLFLVLCCSWIHRGDAFVHTGHIPLSRRKGGRKWGKLCRPRTKLGWGQVLSCDWWSALASRQVSWRDLILHEENEENDVPPYYPGRPGEESIVITGPSKGRKSVDEALQRARLEEARQRWVAEHGSRRVVPLPYPSIYRPGVGVTTIPDLPGGLGLIPQIPVGGLRMPFPGAMPLGTDMFGKRPGELLGDFIKRRISEAVYWLLKPAFDVLAAVYNWILRPVYQGAIAVFEGLSWFFQEVAWWAYAILIDVTNVIFIFIVIFPVAQPDYFWDFYFMDWFMEVFIGRESLIGSRFVDQRMMVDFWTRSSWRRFFLRVRVFFEPVGNLIYNIAYELRQVVRKSILLIKVLICLVVAIVICLILLLSFLFFLGLLLVIICSFFGSLF